jgi:hypothetical protein
MKQMVGIGIGIGIGGGGPRRFALGSMFAAGEPGFFSITRPATCFTDLSGTTQAAAGDAVAYRLDESGRGNHATQATIGLRRILGRMPKSGRRNLLTRTEEFGNAVWEVVAGGAVTLTGTHLSRPVWRVSNQVGTNAGARVQQVLPPRSGDITISVIARTNPSGVICLQIGADTLKQVQFDTATATFFSSGSGAPFVPDIIHQAELINGFWHLRVTYLAMVNVVNAAVLANRRTANTNQYIEVNLLQYELGSTPNPYQRVGSTFDVTEAGQRDCWYLYGGGAADPRWSVTPAIDFTGTDKMTVIAGVRKRSDAAAGKILELSASLGSNDGTFNLRGPTGAASDFGFASKGTVSADAIGTPFAAPVSAVLTGQGDIAGDIARLRVNGVQAANVTTDQGAGNYGNHALHMGSRGGVSNYFNGFDFGVLVRGAATDPATLAQAERAIAQNTPEVYL